MNKKRKLTENGNQDMTDDNIVVTNAADVTTLQNLNHDNHENTDDDNDDHGVSSAQRDDYDHDVELAYINRKRTNYSIKRVSKWTPEMVSVRCFAFHNIIEIKILRINF